MIPVRIVTPPATLPALITTEIRPDDTKILSAVKAADLGQSSDGIFLAMMKIL